jgi:hypothetical protein
MAGKLRVSELMRRATTKVNQETEIMPTNLAALIGLSYMSTGSAWKPLQNVTIEQLRRNFSVAGDPDVYAIVGHEILFGPFVQPDVAVEDAATIEMIYWQKPTALSGAAPTNEILLAYPDLYMYATLVEAARFIVSEQLPVWQQALQEVMFEANEQAQDTNYEGIYMSPADGAV